MTVIVTSPEDVVNLALMRIGYPERVANIFDGTDAANAALNVYSQTRDELLRKEDWGFAERNMNLSLIKSAPQGGYFPPGIWDPRIYPPPPWLYEYVYPFDCLKVRAVKPTPLFIINFDPQPYPFDVENDYNLSPPTKVILTNVQNAVLTYTGQILDPLTWEADFTEALADALGRRLAPVLKGLEETKLEMAAEPLSQRAADIQQG